MVATKAKTARLATLAFAVLAAAACRSKMDVKTVASSEKPAVVTPPPVPREEVNDVQIVGQKTYFQTRDTITISIDKSVIEGAQSFSVLNTTNSGDDDTKATPLISEQVPSFGLAENGSYSLQEISGDKLLLSFYPSQGSWQGKFVYGKNTLKVVAVDNVDPRFSVVSFTLQDFPVIGPAATAFARNVQVETDGVSGYQFQGWVNLVSPPVSTGVGGVQVVTGALRMVNPF